MRIFAFFSLFVTVVGTVAFAGDPYPFQRSDGKWGYVDDNHCWIISPEFQTAQPFNNGLAPVMIAGKWGFIASDGTLAIPAVFDGYKGYGWSKLIFNEGLNGVEIGSRYGFIDLAGQLVIPAQFSDVGSFANGLAPFSINGKWGYINKDGKVAIPPEYDEAFDFIDGQALVGKDKQNSWETDYSHIDTLNAKITASGPWMTGMFHEGLTWHVIDGKTGFKDVAGNVVVPPSFDEAHQFEEGVAAVRIGDRWGYINHSGSFVINPSFDEAWTFQGGRAKVYFGGQPFFIDHSGQILLDPTCDLTP